MRPIWTEREWVVQRVIPRDVFYDHCLTAKEWATSQSTGKFNDLSGEEASRQYLTAKWSAMHSGMDADDVAEERVCYDPASDAFLFIFKVCNNGTTFVVSRHGINFPVDEMD